MHLHVQTGLARLHAARPLGQMTHSSAEELDSALLNELLPILTRHRWSHSSSSSAVMIEVSHGLVDSYELLPMINNMAGISWQDHVISSYGDPVSTASLDLPISLYESTELQVGLKSTSLQMLMFKMLIHYPTVVAEKYSK